MNICVNENENENENESENKNKNENETFNVINEIINQSTKRLQLIYNFND